MIPEVWPPAHVELLKKLHKDGLSASQITDAINREFREAGYSRNAIIGKASRLGLGPIGGGRASAPLAGALNSRKAHAPAPRRRPVEPKGVFVLSPANRTSEPQPPRVVVNRDEAFSPLPGTEPVPFISRPSRACAWPVGGDGADLLCCGTPTGDLMLIYCTPHAEAAISKQAKKKATANELMRALRRWAA